MVLSQTCSYFCLVGTYLIEGRSTLEILDNALAAGYRLFDTAKMYGNEDDIGKAFKNLLPKHKLKRQDIFITTKLLPSDQGAKAYNALRESLTKLDCGYIDLYLIHWPGTYGGGNASKLRAESWKQMVRAVNEGLVRNIGVSNYLVRHLQELLANHHGVKPALNQVNFKMFGLFHIDIIGLKVEWHPHYHPSDLLEFCKKENILLQAYMPLGGSGNSNLLKNKQVQHIATKLKKSPAQVLLKWSLQQYVAIIPKASSRDHMAENIDLDFIIPNDDMDVLNSFKTVKYDWDPESIR
ncbi:glyoxal reductase-like isoform X2 [Cylas formicarius]|uniref:glyoxal reductase-like isoform X2 n=1 Tax=Cylas formicarius TaxID=197179 RepID=UPI0029587FC4|nr:glyoxal reductase-like isoform X2 [Cylas formicarius]